LRFFRDVQTAKLTLLPTASFYIPARSLLFPWIFLT
jgi:hypothetical protein